MSRIKKFSHSAAITRIKQFIKSSAGRCTIVAVSLLATGVGLYLAWPELGTFESFVGHADLMLVLASAACFAGGNLIKAWVWRRMFAGERPGLFQLAGSSGLAALFGLGLPGEVTDVFRIALVRKTCKGKQDVETIGVALATSGMLDPAAMFPFAIFAALAISVSSLIRGGLIAYGILGLALASTVILLPKLLTHPKFSKIGFIDKLGKSWARPKDAVLGWAAATVAFLLRSLALLLLLKAASPGGSFELMLAIQCIGAVTSVIPIGAAGQAAATVGLMTAAGVASSIAVAFSVAAELVVVGAGLVFVPVLLATLLIARKHSAKSHSS